MALVIRGVDDAVGADGVGDVVQVFVLALDLPQDRIQRMLERAVELVALRRAQLVEISVDLLARLGATFPLAPAEVLEHVLVREDGLRDFVQHCRRACRTIALSKSEF
jgi:hypothetical protein